jgi:hypothetical protein
MKEESGMEQETRLAVAELKIEQHGDILRKTQDSIQIMSEGINKLVQAEIRRENDEATFKRLFGEIQVVRGEVHKNKTEFQTYKEGQVTRELKRYQTVFWKALGLVGLTGASIIAGKWLGG